MNDKVIRPDEIPNHDFYEEVNTYEDYINPSKIIGIKYAFAYNFFTDITWFQLLTKLKRLDRVMKNFKTYEELISHINHNEDEKSVSKYGDYYITTSGQHRLCLAKFLNLEKVKVSIKEYRFNENRFNYYNLLKDNLQFLNSLGFRYESNEELIQYTKNMKYLFLKVGEFELNINSEVLSFFIKYYKNLKSNFFYMQYAKLKRRLEPKNMICIGIDTVEDLKKYKYTLLKIKLKKGAFY